MVVFENSVVALSASRMASKKFRTMYLEEEEFTAEGDFMAQDVYVYRKPGKYGIENERYTQENIIEKVLVNKVEPLKVELKTLVDCVRKGEAFPVTPKEALNNLLICEADRSWHKMGYYAHPTAVVESEDIGEGTKIWHFVHVREGSRIGRNCNIGKSVYIDTQAEIGDNVKIQNFVSVYKGVKIEDDVFVGPAVTFTNDLYPRSFSWDEEHVVPTRIYKGASLGANSTIVCGVTVGAYAMIGAGSVVARDVPPYALVLGNPAEIKGWVCQCGRRLRGHRRRGRG